MPQERLADAADRMGLDARGRRILLTMPGLGFGFAPKNYDGFVERIGCPTCSRMMDVIDEAVCPTIPPPMDSGRAARISIRNAIRKAAFERRRAWPVIGRFFPEPTYEYEVMSHGNLTARLDALKAECPRHWGDGEARAISELLMGTYVRSDRLVHGTASP